LLGFVID